MRTIKELLEIILFNKEVHNWLCPRTWAEETWYMGLITEEEYYALDDYLAQEKPEIVEFDEETYKESYLWVGQRIIDLELLES